MNFKQRWLKVSQTLGVRLLMYIGTGLTASDEHGERFYRIHQESRYINNGENVRKEPSLVS